MAASMGIRTPETLAASSTIGHRELTHVSFSWWRNSTSNSHSYLTTSPSGSDIVLEPEDSFRMRDQRDLAEVSPQIALCSRFQESEPKINSAIQSQRQNLTRENFGTLVGNSNQRNSTS